MHVAGSSYLWISIQVKIRIWEQSLMRTHNFSSGRDDWQVSIMTSLLQAIFTVTIRTSNSKINRLPLQAQINQKVPETERMGDHLLRPGGRGQTATAAFSMLLFIVHNTDHRMCP